MEGRILASQPMSLTSVLVRIVLLQDSPLTTILPTSLNPPLFSEYASDPQLFGPTVTLALNSSRYEHVLPK